MCFFKFRNRDFMFFTHFKFFLIWDTFGTVMKQTSNLCIFEVITMDHSQRSAGIHNSKCMCKTIFIKIFCQFLLHFYKIIICHLYSISLCLVKNRSHLREVINLMLLNVIHNRLGHIIMNAFTFLVPLAQKLAGNINIQSIQPYKTSSVLSGKDKSSPDPDSLQAHDLWSQQRSYMPCRSGMAPSML